MEENNEWKGRYENQVEEFQKILPGFTINDFVFMKLKVKEVVSKKSEAIVPSKKVKAKDVPPVKGAVESLHTGKGLKTTGAAQIPKQEKFTELVKEFKGGYNPNKIKVLNSFLRSLDKIIKDTNNEDLKNLKNELIGEKGLIIKNGNQLQNVKKNYDEIIKKMEEIRDKIVS
jgi:hypothetical protein